jgi:endonuclease G
MKRNLLIAIGLVAILQLGSSLSSIVTFENNYLQQPSGRLELPKFRQGDQVIEHFAYTLNYVENYEQASWVAYELTASETVKKYERSDQFYVDPKVNTGSATAIDYKGSGYDRGHLAPAADMGWSSKAMVESFYYSNMSPQDPGFNRGVWKRLEEQVRNWATEYGKIYVVTGPVLKGKLPTIGPSRVAVPNYYYKALLVPSGNSYKGIAFVMANTSSSLSLSNFAVTIDSVEQLTGIDFFHVLSDIEEQKIERTVCTSCWKWSSSGSSQRKQVSTPPIVNSTAVQCSGTTLEGRRCKRTTKSTSGRCFQHD